jgi:coenzyme F420-reducing hydrogenase alpha subunit
MQTLTLEPLRWQEDPARIIVCGDDSQPAVYYQITSPKRTEEICCGRPVEELPRILSMLAPAHHLTAALALDRLFQVDPPELAQNMRTALLQAQYCSAHLRKIFFLLTSRQDPFADFHVAGRGTRQATISARLLEKVAHHGALAQEAEDMLGGRHHHPLTAVAGGVCRYLKEEHFERLADIGKAMVSFGRELAQFMRTEILSEEEGLLPWSGIEIPALAGLYIGTGGQPTLSGPNGSEPRQFNADQLKDIIGLQQEAWTYQPFAYLKEKGWQGVEDLQNLFHVGPLARFNADQKSATPQAEEERQRVIESLGTPPVFKLTATFGAMAVELIQAAETLQSLCKPEKLGGPTLRTIPEHRAVSTWAALEAPQGLTWHHYETDDDGMVQSIAVVDSRSGNNALKCMLAKQVVGDALERKEDPAAIRAKVAIALLPF